jgi:hypothetical protein
MGTHVTYRSGVYGVDAIGRDALVGWRGSYNLEHDSITIEPRLIPAISGSHHLAHSHTIALIENTCFAVPSIELHLMHI